MAHGVDVNINYNMTEDQLDVVLSKLNLLGEQMASVQDVIAAVQAEQSLVKSAVESINLLVAEALKLLQANDPAALEALLLEVQANGEALVQATIAGTEAAALVDAANG